MSDEPAPAVSGGAPAFRATRNAGFVASLIGVLVMVSGRYMAGAPVWLTYVGVSVIVFGWGLFAYALYQRAVLVRAHTAKS